MTVRVGHIEFLNCYPLYFGLEQRAAEGLAGEAAFELVPGVPTGLNRMLLSGTIDFGPISSIEYGRGFRQLRVSRRLSISSNGAVDSIQLVSRRPLEEVQRIALTPKSATSVTLLKTVMKLKYGLSPVYDELLQAPEDALCDHDAVLLIGDEALEALYYPVPDTRLYDLGRIWREWTGHPMVYAVWAAREDFLSAHSAELLAVEDELVRSMDYSRQAAPRVVQAASVLWRFDRPCLDRYFEVLHYGFSERYREGLRKFFELAYEAGELADVPELRFFGNDGEAGQAAPPPRPAVRPSPRVVAPAPIDAALVERIRAGARLTDEEALALLRSRDLLSVGQLAAERRARQVPGDVVTFIIDRNINYTNICLTGCDFCAFYRSPGAEGGYLLAKEEIFSKIEETLALEGTAVLMQGGLHPDLDIAFYEDLFRSIKERFTITIHSLSPPEIIHIAKLSGLTTRVTLERLRAAGLDSLPGGGAEILVDRVRQHVAPKKARTEPWLQVMREAHELGMGTTATMMFGSVETLEERVEHLRRIRDLQDESLGRGLGGFRAFIPWTFQEGNSALEGFTEPATAADYLVTLAVSRIYLDNVANIQASWVTQGLKIGQVALQFGANDVGSTMIEENVVAAAGVAFSVGADDLVAAIRAAGYVPAQRRTDYSLVRTFAGRSAGGDGEELEVGSGLGFD